MGSRRGAHYLEMTALPTLVFSGALQPVGGAADAADAADALDGFAGRETHPEHSRQHCVQKTSRCDCWAIGCGGLGGH